MEPRRLRVVFMGTPAFGLGPLQALLNADFVDVSLVVTRPDAVSGRGKKLLPSPVKALAIERGLPVLETKTLRTPEVQEVLAQQNADVFCVAAYGAILPSEVLTMAPLGCLNVHASLLPAGRGAAPMQRALLEGEPRLGFSIMQIEEGLDTGPYCLQGSVEAGERTYDEISTELSTLGGEALIEVLRTYACGEEPAWTVQDDARATHAAKLDKGDVLLDSACSAVVNRCRVQASSDAAPARCLIAGRPVRVLKAHVLDADEQAALAGRPASGEVRVAQRRLLLGCADGVLEVLEIKPDGKRAMEAAAFAAGIHATDATWEAL